MEFTLPRGKRPSERFDIGIDFTPDLGGSDPAVSHIVTAYDDADQDVSATFLEGAALAGNISKVFVKAGIDGMTYNVVFKVTSAAGEKFEHSIVVPVMTPR